MAMTVPPTRQKNPKMDWPDAVVVLEQGPMEEFRGATYFVSFQSL